MSAAPQRNRPQRTVPLRNHQTGAASTPDERRIPSGDRRWRVTADGGGRPAGSVLVLGGAGFVGANLTARLLCEGARVTVLDDLSRRGAEKNLAWLSNAFGSALEVRVADVRDRPALRAAVRGATMVYHFAGQVAVTTSLADPWTDFEVNVGGTLEVLEALRELADPPPLLYTSTNKIYGRMSDIELVARSSRYEPSNGELRRFGIPESRPIDFHTPYGCSKGAADQYVLDYARSFDLPAIVFRMSCIYGPRQNGTEDQGWVAHLLRRALIGAPLKIFGDGLQVRDLLYVGDLVEALLLARERIGELRQRVFNIGGGVENSLSLREFCRLLEERLGLAPAVEPRPWRAGDQPYFVSDTRAFSRATGWRPRIGVGEGIERLALWLQGELQPPVRPSAALALRPGELALQSADAVLGIEETAS